MAFFATELANLPVLSDLVSQSVVLPREPFRTALRALESDFGLRFVCLHVHLQSVLAGELPVAPKDETGEAAPVDLLPEFH